ncbi:MAG: hypothetical protein PWP23_432 [Candidatus Sumerlaeota bacterium]|nr:hypothetical protein [Candidatus Sumerlaeota bacterium]
MARKAGVTVWEATVWAGRGVAAVLALAALVMPHAWWIAAAATALLAAGLHVGLAVHTLHHRWLREGSGREPGLGAFLRGNLHGLLILGGSTLVVMMVFTAWRMPLAPEVRAIVWNALLVPLLLLVGGLLLKSRREGSETSRLRADLPATPVAELVQKAIEFQRDNMRGLLGVFLKLYAALFLVGALASAAALGLGWLGLRRRDAWTDVLVHDLPLALKLAILLGWAALFFLVMAALLTTCRLVHNIRREGGASRRRLWSETDTAMGTLGILATVVASSFFLALLTGFGFAGYAIHGWLIAAGTAPWQAFGTAVLAVLLMTWSLVIVPCQWVIPMMVEHDCGWVRGVAASAALTGVERLRAYRLGAAALMLGSTVVLLPAAAALMLLALEELGPLVGLVLGEMHERNVRASVNAISVEKAIDRPKALQRAYAALDQGRYLDAVNGFQMFLHKNFGHLDALRGECLSFLALGNTAMARERLERWMRLDVENPEPIRLYRELMDGRWSEGGDLYAAAQARCVQDPGKGVTQRETLGFDPAETFGPGKES